MEEQSSKQNAEVNSLMPPASQNGEPTVLKRSSSGQIDLMLCSVTKKIKKRAKVAIAIAAVILLLLLICIISISSICKSKSLDDAHIGQDVTTPSTLKMDTSTATSSVMDKVSTQTPRVQLGQSFQFYMDLDKEYESAFNNRSSQASHNFTETFQTEMDVFYKNSADIQSMYKYVRTEVNQLRLKGTITRVEFTIYVRTDGSNYDVVRQLTNNIPQLSYYISSYVPRQLT